MATRRRRSGRLFSFDNINVRRLFRKHSPRQSNGFHSVSPESFRDDTTRIDSPSVTENLRSSSQHSSSPVSVIISKDENDSSFFQQKEKVTVPVLDMAKGDKSQIESIDSPKSLEVHPYAIEIDQNIELERNNSNTDNANRITPVSLRALDITWESRDIQESTNEAIKDSEVLAIEVVDQDEQNITNVNDENSLSSPRNPDSVAGTENKENGGSASPTATSFLKKKFNRKNMPINPSPSSRSSKISGKFEVGDKVRVVQSHSKRGKTGVVEKITAAYVFFRDMGSNETIKIKPKSLEHASKGILSDITNTNRRESNDVTTPPQQSTSKKITATTAEKAGNKGIVQSTFDVGSSVQVKKGHKHAGKGGIVKRHTTNFVVVVLDGNGNTETRIKSKFLESSYPLNATSPSSTRTKQSSTVVPAQVTHNFDEWKVPPSSNESKLFFGDSCLDIADLFNGGFVEKFHLERKVSQKIDNFFKVRWSSSTWNYGSRFFVTEQSVARIESDRENLPIKLPNSCLPGVFELYHAEIVKEKGSGDFFGYMKPKRVLAYYVQTDGPNLGPVNLREHEEWVANFGALNSRKVAARRKLALSPALKIGDDYALFEIDDCNIDMIEDVGTTGCGFIDEEYLESLFKSKAVAKKVLSVQIRIFCPSKGIFKGMLMRKRGVPNSIQLNESLQKVLPSKENGEYGKSCLVITKKFPSNTNEQVGRLFQKTGRNITPTFTKNLKSGKVCSLSDMILRLWKGLGVPTDVIKDYCEASKSPEGLCHTYLIGVADPTNELPPGSVFLTGAPALDLEELFVTRSPCVEKKDGRMLKLVTSKPPAMSDENWAWLRNLSFGAIIFGDPEPGYLPLPELIASGDLDGDLYFVCWNKLLLSHMNHIPILDEEQIKPVDNEAGKIIPYDPDWFENAQEFISRVPHLVDLNSLIGCLYKEGEKFADIGDPDAVSFMQAYKQALEIEKHGGKVFLPLHLKQRLPEKFHQFLKDSLSVDD